MQKNKNNHTLEEKNPLVYGKSFYDEIDNYKSLFQIKSPLTLFESDVTIAILTVIGFKEIKIKFNPNSLVLTGIYNDHSLIFEISHKTSPFEWFFRFVKTLEEFLKEIGVKM
ncbi:MAG: hypothetical protein HWN65_08220 [Candidatus Helarchaeota archaeon]|nr:hypothetical protein [Candidatus Helarchaeota archaeon]